MDFRVVWTEPASEDLEGIIRYIARRNPLNARRIRLAILDHAQILASFPFIGAAFERDASGKIREIAYKTYRIFYRVTEEAATVEILTVWHGARRDPQFPVE